LREERRVLRTMFGSNRDEVTGDWRRRHNEELCELCFPPNIIRVIEPIIIIIIIIIIMKLEA
jgi:hypothetical protein